MTVVWPCALWSSGPAGLWLCGSWQIKKESGKRQKLMQSLQSLVNKQKDLQSDLNFAELQMKHNKFILDQTNDELEAEKSELRQAMGKHEEAQLQVTQATSEFTKLRSDPALLTPSLRLSGLSSYEYLSTWLLSLRLCLRLSLRPLSHSLTPRHV